LRLIAPAQATCQAPPSHGNRVVLRVLGLAFMDAVHF
jgi:hypothetical protein